MSISELPLITVVIPAHNAEKYIAESVRSAFAQTYAPLEVLVIDDGSTDQTAKVAQLAGATVVQQANAGVSSARNRGIALAKGEWIAFLDADDRWHPEKLRKQCDVLENHPEVAFIATDFSRERQYIVKDIAWMVTRQAYRDAVANRIQDAVVLLAPEELALSLAKENFIPTSSVMVRRKLLREVAGFDEQMDYCEDHDCWLRLLRDHGAAIVQLPLVAYRMHDDSASAHWARILEGDVQLARQIQNVPHRYHPDVVTFSQSRLTQSLFDLGQHCARSGNARAAVLPLWQSFQRKQSFKTLFWLSVSAVLSLRPLKAISVDIRTRRQIAKTQAA